jgi:Leucine-rich repeat (LRR) protein
MIYIKFNLNDNKISYNSFDDIINLTNYNDIVYIDCSYNQLNKITNLPQLLKYLDCSNN